MKNKVPVKSVPSIDGCLTVMDSSGLILCDCIDAELAAELVRIINSHGALVEACKEALSDHFAFTPESKTTAILNAALQLAESP